MWTTPIEWGKECADENDNCIAIWKSFCLHYWQWFGTFSNDCNIGSSWSNRCLAIYLLYWNKFFCFIFIVLCLEFIANRNKSAVNLLCCVLSVVYAYWRVFVYLFVSNVDEHEQRINAQNSVSGIWMVFFVNLYYQTIHLVRISHIIDKMETSWTWNKAHTACVQIQCHGCNIPVAAESICFVCVQHRSSGLPPSLTIITISPFPAVDRRHKRIFARFVKTCDRKHLDQ